MEVGGGRRRSAEVGGGPWRSWGGLVAPYGGVHSTRRWCATVRRGQHTKSAGYSGHVTATGS